MKQYTQQDVLDLIEQGEKAHLLCSQHFPTMQRRMTAAVKKLTALRKEVETIFPDATFYTGSGGLKLLLGESHSRDGKSQQELVAYSFSHLIIIGDGDW